MVVCGQENVRKCRIPGWPDATRKEVINIEATSTSSTSTYTAVIEKEKNRIGTIFLASNFSIWED